MRLRSVTSTIADVVRMNHSFVTDSMTRAALRRAIGRRPGSPPGGAAQAELDAAEPSVKAYLGLSSGSLALAGIRVSESGDRYLNVVIGEITATSLFAGVHTALTVASQLAARLGLPLRVIMLDWTSPGNSAATAAALIHSSLTLEGVEVVEREHVRAVPFTSSDVWLATHSKTAHAVQVAAIAGLIPVDRVVYLIQDYEPGFSAWSTDSVTAAATYHAGFLPLVNSVPLWEYLTQVEGLAIDRGLVFGPSLDADALRAAAAARMVQHDRRILFYARPGKARNLFHLGIASLRVAARELAEAGERVEFLSIGEPHDDVQLADGAVLHSVGRLGWREYFDFIATVDVLLSLQQSPHPSHPPFDVAISGGYAVTNDFDGRRRSMHPRIVTAPATPGGLGSALVGALDLAATDDHGYQPLADASLGAPLADALELVAARLLSD